MFEASLNFFGIVLLAAYCAVIFLVSLKAAGGGREGFFVNNRKSGALGVALSIIVSCVGASATIGVIGLAYKVGTPAFWWLGAGCVGLGLLAVFLSAKVRQSGAYTMPQIVESHMGKSARPLVSVIIVLAWMAILAAQFVALNKILPALTDLPGPFCQALSFALIVLHTLGGQAAIMRVDRIQALVLMAALLALLCWLGGANPDWPARVQLEAVNEGFPPRMLLYFALVVGGNYLVCPMLFGRLLSATDSRAARRGALGAVAGLALCSVLIVCIGLACRGLLDPALKGDDVLTALLDGQAPAWLSLFTGIALVSAIVSSADSCLVTAATVLSRDLLNRTEAGTSRLCVLFLGLAGLALSFWGRDILGYLLMAYDVYVCGVVIPVFIGLVLSSRHSIKPAFACAAILTGGALGAASALCQINELSYVGMAASALLTLAGTRTSKLPLSKAVEAR